MKEKIKKIKNWDELTNFISAVNPNKKTIILVGYINVLYNNKTFIKELIFSTKDIEILKEKNDRQIKKLDKRTNKKNSRKQR